MTTIRDIEGTLWYVRNGTITRVGNFSQHFSIALVDVPVGHGADLTRATELASHAATEAVAEKPLADDLLGEVAVLGVQSVTPEGITLRVTVTTRPGRQARVRRALFEAIATAFHRRPACPLPHPPPPFPSPPDPAGLASPTAQRALCTERTGRVPAQLGVQARRGGLGAPTGRASVQESQCQCAADRPASAPVSATSFGEGDRDRHARRSGPGRAPHSWCRR